MMIPAGPHAGLLRYELLPGEPLDAFSLDVLTQNPPPGVLRPGRETTEAHDHLLFPVAGLAPLKSADPIVLEATDPDKLLAQVETVRDALPRYLLPPESLILRPEYTWLEPQTGEVRLLCLPTPAAQTLSLPMEEYAALVRTLWPELLTEKRRIRESAEAPRKQRRPPKSLRQIAKEFWDDLD